MKRKWWIAGALFLVELALCGAIVGVSWGSIGAARNAGLQYHFFSFDSVSAAADEEQRAAVTGAAVLEVDNRHGEIRVLPGGSGEVVVAAHKTAWGPGQAEAEARLAALQVVVTQAGNAVTVRVERPDDITIIGSRRSDTVDLLITVPAATAVTARTGFGAITLAGVAGDADLQTGNGAVTVSDVTGDLALSSDFGEISVARAEAGRVEAHTSNGGIELSEVEARRDVHLSSNFGSLRFEGGSAAALDLESDNGSIVLDDLLVSGAAVLRSSLGDLTLTDVAARSYDLFSDNGDIVVDGAAGVLQAGGNFGNISITHGEAVTLDLQSDNGQIAFAGSLAGGPHTVTTKFGDVTLSLPADTALTVDMETGFGRVATDFPITVSGTADSGHLRGALNGGGAALTVSSDNGNVTLSLLES